MYIKETSPIIPYLIQTFEPPHASSSEQETTRIFVVHSVIKTYGYNKLPNPLLVAYIKIALKQKMDKNIATRYQNKQRILKACQAASMEIETSSQGPFARKTLHLKNHTKVIASQ